MNPPTISIIVPVYKAEQHIKKCLDSIREQTYKDFEVIIVDDGSPDNSGRICDHYSELDTRFTTIHQKNKGASSARNTGLTQAKGKWVTFIDSDDWISPQYIENYFNGEMADIIFQGIQKEHRNKTITQLRLDENPTKDFITDLLYIEQNNLLGWSFNKILRNDIIKNNNIKFPIGISLREDLIFCLKYLQYAKSITWRDVTLYHYVEQSNSLISSIHPYSELDKANELIFNLRQIISHLFSNKEYSEFSRHAYQRFKIMQIRSAYYSKYRLNKTERLQILRNIPNIASTSTLGHTDILIYKISQLNISLYIKDLFIGIISHLHEFKHY